MAYLELRLLGSFHVSLAGKPLKTFESNKVRALLAYLVCEPQCPHPRESLATLLWPEWPDRSALSNLRYALSDLRKAIGDREANPPYLRISREAIQFNVESDCLVDVAEFIAEREGRDITGLKNMLEFYQGEFLEGFSINDAAPFEDWVRLKREQLHRTFVESLHHISASLERNGEIAAALTYARRGVEAEPWNENGQLHLMRLLAANGKRSEAIAQYAACQEAMIRELGAKPSPETTRLHDQILAGQFERRSPAASVATPSPDKIQEEEEIPLFVGREQELSKLQKCLEVISKIPSIR